MEWIRRQCDMQDQRRMGKKEQAIETAKRMLKRNKLTIAEIAEDTALDVSIVEELAAELQKKDNEV